MGGRKEGLPTKIKLALTVKEKLEELGFDPLEHMHKLIHDPKTPIDVAARLTCEYNKYVFPQLKSVQHTGIPDTNVAVQINVGHLESLRTRVASVTLRERASGVLPVAIPERASGD